MMLKNFLILLPCSFQLFSAITSAIILTPLKESRYPTVLILNDIHFERYNLRGNTYFRDLFVKQADALVESIEHTRAPLLTEGATAPNIGCEEIEQRVRSFYAKKMPIEAPSSAMDYIAQKYYQYALSIDIRALFRIIYFLIKASPKHPLPAAYRSKLSFSGILSGLMQKLQHIDQPAVAQELQNWINHIQTFCINNAVNLEKPIEEAIRHVFPEHTAEFLSFLEQRDIGTKVVPHLFEYFACYLITTMQTPLIIVNCGLAHGTSIQHILETKYRYTMKERLDGKIIMTHPSQEYDKFFDEMRVSKPTENQIAQESFERYCVQPDQLADFIKHYVIVC